MSKMVMVLGTTHAPDIFLEVRVTYVNTNTDHLSRFTTRASCDSVYLDTCIILLVLGLPIYKG